MREGLFRSINIEGRNILKLAPDAFIIMNNSFGTEIVSPVDIDGGLSSSRNNLHAAAGITSINVSSAVNPAGAGRASIEIVSPQYKGLHKSYYIDMPNGVKIPYFIPMTEVKIYMKGRFLPNDKGKEYRPQYYPVFWGFITNVTESYHDGVNSFSINCVDLLNWWSLQKLTIAPSSLQYGTGAPAYRKIPTVFLYLNPWEIMYTLFMDVGFIYGGTENWKSNIYNFLFPTGGGVNPLPGVFSISEQNKKGTTEQHNVLSALVADTNRYWQNRFGFRKFMQDVITNQRNSVGADGDKKLDALEALAYGKAAIEMMGLQGDIDISKIAASARNHLLTESDKITRNRTVHSKLSIDFSLLSRVQPYGQFSLINDGTQSTVETKLDIANKVCAQSSMEFFLDFNGSFVFKPPLYNLDVATGEDKTYVVKADDIISSSFGHNVDGIVNFLEVTGPLMSQTTDLTYRGVHIDYDSIKRYGMRYHTLEIKYGNTPKTLRALAVAEMAKINSKAETGTVAIPARPEMRLGYPIYLPHIDAFYYVTGASHSISFGSGSTTTLTLSSKRGRVYDDGSVTGVPGKILKGYVTKLRNTEKEVMAGTPKSTGGDVGEISDEDVLEYAYSAMTTADSIGEKPDIEQANVDLRKKMLLDTAGIQIGNDTKGLVSIVPASKYLDPSSSVGNNPALDPSAYTPQSVMCNQLIHITKETVPYSDMHGYRHIGAFPYGANLKLNSGKKFIDATDVSTQTESKVSSAVNIEPY